MNNIILPIINKPAEPLPEDLWSIQSMTSPTGEIFKLKISSVSEPVTAEDLHGKLRHSFLNGWERNYHGQWIGMDLWRKIKVAGY